MNILLGLLVGVLIGVFSGLVGVGGGIILVPILIYAFHMDQHQAQGTSLAMLLPPTGLLAFLNYYKAGHADVKLGLLIAAGVFVGGYFGGEWAQHTPQEVMRKVFAVVLAGVAVKMFLQK
ncbi:MAG TPA: sulfite exporter TauE/SafE family protein [Terriglobales bacterium]|nr:sulfite exporter TauE/SafE family protein [Terriglobales bacterium]